jgi:hypothetical protein
VNEDENSIRRVGRTQRNVSAPEPEPEAPKKKRRTAEIPDHIRQRFVQVKGTYYFPDGTAAFRDRGARLTTRSENTEVVKSLVEIAQARGWGVVEVSGSERFRREAWSMGSALGLSVRGYEPSEFERSRMVRSMGRPADPTGTPPSYNESGKPRARDGLITGKLVDFGAAPYRDNARAAMSYFVKVETPNGDRVVWGVDLERALRESLTKPGIGDEVGLRTVGKEGVKVRTPVRNEQGTVTGEQAIETVRNRWVVEKRPFFDERTAAATVVRNSSVDAKAAVKQHPQLVGTYLQLHAAELAAKRFRDPADQALFVAKVRSALADSVGRGEPLPAVRLKQRTRESTLTR